MAQIRLTKEFSFEMAHFLTGYDGSCSNIHGHSYRLFVTVIGQPIEDTANPKLGMVMDFGMLKSVVNKRIVSRLDHALLMNNNEESKGLIPILKDRFKKVDAVDFQPTCENLLLHFVDQIQTELPDGITLHHLKLYETATSYAEWYNEDNK
ncbi:MAG TPA: 6-carboxytetrahydropterin synthase [Williamwhitmania sp.]|nr:6-carboxytetrahydropterin synthase [Williamwhitmania sp.]